MSWPLVERRRGPRDTDGPDRRDPTAPVTPQRLDDLARANDLLLSLQSLAVTISSSLDEEEVIRRGVDRARQLVAADAVLVLLVDESGGWRTASGPNDRVAATIDARVLACLESKRAVSLDGGQIWAAADHGVYRALTSRGETVGILAAEWLPGNRPDAAQTEALVGVADALAIALDNARIFARLADRAAADERARMARELHDRVAGSLAALGYEVDGLARGLDADAADRVNRLRARLNVTIDELRGILDDLRTGRDGSGLTRAALDDLAARVRARSNVVVDVDGRFEPLVDSVGSELLLIVGEAMFNAERHSGARQVTVRVTRSGDLLVASVADDGCGLGGAVEGHGLRGMRERAEWIGADLRIDSSDAGTTVTVSVDTSVA